MVEVPLDLEAELPREFEGSALLASTGLPRKVRLKAQRDLLKLSTAYRADQLLADWRASVGAQLPMPNPDYDPKK